MRSFSLPLLLQCGKYTDLRKVTEGEEQDKYSRLLDLLTPVAKSYPSEMGTAGFQFRNEQFLAR